jgi:hypothetical protein
MIIATLWIVRRERVEILSELRVNSELGLEKEAVMDPDAVGPGLTVTLLPTAVAVNEAGKFIVTDAFFVTSPLPQLE